MTEGVPPPSTSDIRNVYARLKIALDEIRSLMVTIAVIVVFSFVFVAIVIDVGAGTYLIEPITVPSGFQAEAQDKDGVASQLRDAIGVLSKLARDDVAIRPVQADASEPKISITGTSFSVREVATFVREHTGHAYPVIGGELRVLRASAGNGVDPAGVGGGSQQVHLTLRLSDGIAGPFFEGSGEYAEVIRNAAVAALHEIDPISAAGALSTMDRQHRLMAEAWIDDVLLLEHGDKVRGRSPPWVSPDISRALLTKANVSLSLEEYGAALDGFDAANTEFKAHHGKDWSSAKDGQATAYLLRAESEWRRRGEGVSQLGLYQDDIRTAEERVREALAIEPDYGSAMYHFAQIADARARHWFEAADPYDATKGCDGFSERAEADGRYAALTSRYPNFAVAYDRQAAMIMQELLWLRSNRVTPCGVGSASAAAFEQNLFDAAEGLFVAAQAHDPMLADPWLQGGILLAEEQQAGYSLNAFSPSQRRTMLKMAVLRFSRASALSSWDGYVWQRWARAEHQLAELGMDAAGPLEKGADEHFCAAASVFEDAWISRGAALHGGFGRGAEDVAGALGERRQAGFRAPCPGLTPASARLFDQ